MAKTSSIEKNKRRARLAKLYAGRRSRLKAIARDKNLTMEERFAATLTGDSSARIRFAKGAVAAIEFDDEVIAGGGELYWLATAKLLGV